MDVDLTQRRAAGINESVWCVRGNHHDTTCAHFKRFIAHCDGGAAFERKRDLDVGMGVQRRALSRLRLDNISRQRRIMLFADEFVRHPDKWQLLNIHEAHTEVYAPKAGLLG